MYLGDVTYSHPLDASRRSQVTGSRRRTVASFCPLQSLVGNSTGGNKPSKPCGDWPLRTPIRWTRRPPCLAGDLSKLENFSPIADRRPINRDGPLRRKRPDTDNCRDRLRFSGPKGFLVM